MKTLQDYIYESNKFFFEDDLLGGDSDDSKEDDSKEKDEKDDDEPSDEQKGVSKGKDKEKSTIKGDIKFTIWKESDKKVKWIDDNESYQKIEYKYEDKKEDISIDFLLGFQEDSWKLWIGKIGACSYDDDPYCSFETDKFSHAIIKCLNKVEEFLSKVKQDPDNYVQFYLHR